MVESDALLQTINAGQLEGNSGTPARTVATNGSLFDGQLDRQSDPIHRFEFALTVEACISPGVYTLLLLYARIQVVSDMYQPPAYVPLYHPVSPYVRIQPPPESMRDPAESLMPPPA